jgi:hypothetical protein
MNPAAATPRLVYFRANSQQRMAYLRSAHRHSGLESRFSRPDKMLLT